MHASDVMTTNVVSVESDTGVREIADLLLKHRISAVPVVNDDKTILGLVSEGDLIRRVETNTDARHSWWLADAFSLRDKTADYIKTHGHRAEDIMTHNVITVKEDTSLSEIAGLLEKHHIKRVPVTRDSKLVGIVSRANLLHGLASATSQPVAAPPTNDKDMRKAVVKEICQAVGSDAPLINATVSDGVVQLWGNVESEMKKKAAQIAAECVVGVQTVDNHIHIVPAWKPAY